MKDYSAIVQQLAQVSRLFDSEYWGELSQLTHNLNNDLAAAREQGRNLRIAVVGQMKAGKSSFLNAAFFGHDLLPKADTPMTAALTKIAYAAKPRAEVVFYSQNDWNDIESKAKEYDKRYKEIEQELQETNSSPFSKKVAASSKPSPELIKSQIGMDFRASKELVEKAKQQGLNLSDYLGKTIQLQDVGDATALASKLHEYVGSGGKFTAITKMTELHVNKEELQGLEIYDTPGFNDPVVSRGQQTRNFLGQCDVVFLLSSLAQFCGKADLALLRDQLRDAGIDEKAVILIGSQRDIALRQSKEVVKTAQEMAAKLSSEKRAAGTVAAMIFVLTQRMNEYIKSTLQEILRQPTMDERSRHILSALQKRDPLYISAWCWMIAETYNHLFDDDQEQLQALCDTTGFEFTPESLKQFSNIPAVRQVVLDQINVKEELTKRKEQLLIDGAGQGFKDKLGKISTALNSRVNQINQGDIVELQALQKTTQTRILQGRGKLEAVFDICLFKVQSDFALLKTEIKEQSLNYSRIDTKKETHTKSYEVSTSKWYNPFSWGSKETRYEDVVTIYASAHDAIEKIEQFAIETRRSLQRTIMSLVNLEQLRLQVSQAAMSLFDTGNAGFDGELMMMEVEKSLRRLSIPEVDFGDKDYSNIITQQFSSDRVSENKIDGLKQAQKAAVQAVMVDLENAVKAKTTEISLQLTNTSKSFVDTLVKDIESGLSKLCQDIENKEIVLKELMNAKKIVEEVLCEV